ncbi:MAG: hypothetical protein AVDCRST_MAG64-3771, partial [uncultured Phycisphaerae bacterium]
GRTGHTGVGRCRADDGRARQGALARSRRHRRAGVCPGRLRGRVRRPRRAHLRAGDVAGRSGPAPPVRPDRRL